MVKLFRLSISRLFPSVIFRKQFVFCVALAALGLSVPTQPMAQNPAQAAIPASSGAERVFASAPPRLLQIRSIVEGAERQSTVGSGFLVTGDGLAITNYHVVSQVALEPEVYRLEYSTPDGSHGQAKLVAIDLANDLAAIRLDKKETEFFEFNGSALTQGLAKGERLYSMGNPLDLGFTIIEGTYNGLVERSYNERIHFSGALNAGMSGGPAVTGDGRVVGVNVAKSTGGELVSFLVPGRFAAALLQRVKDGTATQAADFRAEIGKQLTAWQSALYKAVSAQDLRPLKFGPYQAPESAARWFTCWAQTNSGVRPRPRASVNATNCGSNTGLFVASDLMTGNIQLGHSYIRTEDLNDFQFATLLSQQSQPRQVFGGAYKKWYTPQRCYEDFMAAGPAADRPALRVVWCAQAYREFAGLYDVSVIAVTEDRGREALVSRLGLQAVGFDDATLLSKRFLEAVRWTK